MKKKSRGPRPKMGNTKATRQIQVRYTPDLGALIDQAARQKELSTVDFIRAVTIARAAEITGTDPLEIMQKKENDEQPA